MKASRSNRRFPLLYALLCATALSACQITQFMTSAPPVVSELQIKAESGDAKSQYRVGLRYSSGTDVEQNYATALKWFERAAAQGHVGAQYFTAIAYSTGRGAGVDKPRAVEWFAKAADAGHVPSQYQMGAVYANGRGVNQDSIWAARWFGKAALRGHQEAMFSYGVFRAAAKGVPRDDIDAWQWLELAARKGHAQAAKVRDRIGAGLNAADRKAAAWVAAWQAAKTDTYADVPTVRYLQIVLTALGFPTGPADGAAGPRTNKAISDFRASADLAPGAAIDPALMTAVRLRIAPQGS